MEIIVDKTIQHVKKIDISNRGISASVATFDFQKDHKISTYLLALTKKIHPPATPLTTNIIQLSQIEDSFAKVSGTLDSFNSNMNKILQTLEDLDSHEEFFLKLNDNCEKRVQKLEEFLVDADKITIPPKNTKNSIQELSETDEEISIIKHDYTNLFNSIQSPITELTEFVERVTKTNSEMAQIVTAIQEIDKITNGILDNFVEDINLETRSVISFANICSNPLPKEKRELLISQRMEFEKFATKLKEKVEGFR